MEFLIPLAVIFAASVFVLLRLSSKECSCGEFDEEAGDFKERD
ncbi:hypothetical protein [Thermovibrio sp.]